MFRCEYVFYDGRQCKANQINGRLCHNHIFASTKNKHKCKLCDKLTKSETGICYKHNTDRVMFYYNQKKNGKKIVGISIPH